ncbi:hypothetical protein HJG60_007954 [Phyllostomus discolor]|uniref:Uncharacterized protein n=1 Tax=Phyllostomus discolor TaxID=89673 RepID=A0A834BL11_9CHIR|nr:hypothetical protein HJG60_007954 [Phyllostomus discolor]
MDTADPLIFITGDFVLDPSRLLCRGLLELFPLRKPKPVHPATVSPIGFPISRTSCLGPLLLPPCRLLLESWILTRKATWPLRLRVCNMPVSAALAEFCRHSGCWLLQICWCKCTLRAKDTTAAWWAPILIPSLACTTAHTCC